MNKSKASKSLLSGAREALDYARGTWQGYVVHAPKRESLFVEELTDAEVEAIAKAAVSPEYDDLNVEYED